MPNKEFTLEEGITLTIFKRRTSRNLRLSIRPDGQARVSIPAWAPYGVGFNFAKARIDWIRSQQVSPRILKHGQAIGKAHHLQFVAKAEITKISSQVRGSTVTISHPNQISPRFTEVQKAAEKACVRALRAQAEQLLPQRLSVLAATHDLQYKSVSIKRLKSRWGSCDQDKNIVLNLFLMQLPWELIDYVLLHELTHTKILRHGPTFWRAMEAKLPNVAKLRKAVRAHQPVLLAAMA